MQKTFDLKGYLSFFDKLTLLIYLIIVISHSNTILILL